MGGNRSQLLPCCTVCTGCVQRAPFRRFMEMIRSDSREFEAGGRVLRLKQYMAADANCAMMEEVIAALSANTRVGALYIQNFEWVRLLRWSLTILRSWEDS